MREYPKFFGSTVFDVITSLQFIIKERIKDVSDWNNLNKVFISGRKVARIPSGATDVLDTDRIGDINFTASYGYVLIDNAGTAEWRRFALASW